MAFARRARRLLRGVLWLLLAGGYWLCLVIAYAGVRSLDRLAGWIEKRVIGAADD